MLGPVFVVLSRNISHINVHQVGDRLTVRLPLSFASLLLQLLPSGLMLFGFFLFALGAFPFFFNQLKALPFGLLGENLLEVVTGGVGIGVSVVGFRFYARASCVYTRQPINSGRSWLFTSSAIAGAFCMVVRGVVPSCRSG